MSSSDENPDDFSRARFQAPLTMSDLRSDKGFLMESLDMEGNSDYEKHTTQNPEIYFKHDDLMKFVDFTVSESLTEYECTPFENMKLNMTDITDGSGRVFKKVIKAGVGEVCPSDSVVKFHYIAFREGEEVPYDVSRLRKKFPETAQLGTNALIPGLELGISSMRLNEESHFLIHPDYAYGSLGVGPRIPGGATLLFKVELLGIERFKLPENEEFDIIQEEHDFENLYTKAKTHIQRGNQIKREKNNGAAIKEYRTAISILIKTPLKNDEEEKKKRHAITKVYLNLMICLNDENLYRKVCIAYKDALYEGCGEAENNPRLIFHLAKAQCGLHDFDQARKLFLHVKKLDPKEGARVDEALRELEEKKKKCKEEERLLAGRMFQFN